MEVDMGASNEDEGEDWCRYCHEYGTIVSLILWCVFDYLI